jgi:mannosyltransferase OCH1-like enzyme
MCGIFILYNEYVKYKVSQPDRKYYQRNGVKNVIPLHIYQTWHTKEDLLPNMRECVETLKAQNPEFIHHLFDDDDCRDFITDNFSKDVINAYDSLIPGAYKADLWRYCILYKRGGVYMDVKYKCADDVKLIDLVDKEYYVEDRPQHENRGVYNAVMICEKGDPKLLKAIYSIVDHVKQKYYGETPLSPTGPGLLGKIFTDDEFRDIRLKFVFDEKNGMRLNESHTIINKTNNKVVFVMYPEYRKDQLKYKDSHPHYGELWDNNKIYK